MLKRVLLFSVFFIFVARCSWSDEPINWEKKYGEGLVNIPLPWRQQFQLATGISWYEASIEEQRGFLDELLVQKKSRDKERKLKLQEKEKLKRESVERDRLRASAKAAEAEKERQAGIAEAQQKVAKMQKLLRLQQARESKMNALRARARSRNAK